MLGFVKKHYFILIVASFLLYCTVIIFRSSIVFNGVRYFILSDDLMIQMKYAYNLIHGHGLVWNAAGPRVEGITDPLWVIYLGLLQLIPLTLSKVSILVQISGAVFMVGSLYFVKKIAVLVSNSLPVIVLSVIFTAFYFPLINWSVVLGTEISIMTLFLTTAVYLTLKALQEKKFPLLLFFVFGIGTLIRMDFLIPAIIITAYLVIFDPKYRRKYLTTGIPIVLFFVALQEILAFWYYGVLVPNTYNLRLAGYPVLPRITRGIYVTIKAFSPSIISLDLLLIPLTFAYAYFTKNKQLWLLLVLFAGEIAYNIYLGGDSWENYGGANHFFAFVMPLFFISLIVAVDASLKTIRKTITKNSQLLFTVFAIFLVGFLFIEVNHANNTELLELFQVVKPTTVFENWIRLGEVTDLNKMTTPSAKTVVSGAGIISFFGHGYFVDALGKNDKVIAAEKAHVPAKFASIWQEYTYFYSGHMKWDYPYIVRTYKPDVITELFGSFETADNAHYLLTHGYVPLGNQWGFFVLKGSKNVIPTPLTKYSY